MYVLFRLLIIDLTHIHRSLRDVLMCDVCSVM